MNSIRWAAIVLAIFCAMLNRTDGSILCAWGSVTTHLFPVYLPDQLSHQLIHKKKTRQYKWLTNWLANENQAPLHPTSQQPLHSSTGGALICPTAIQGTCQSQLGSWLPQAPCTRWKSRGSGQCCYQYIDGSFLLLILQGESPETPNLTYSLIKPLQ